MKKIVMTVLLMSMICCPLRADMLQEIDKLIEHGQYANAQKMMTDSVDTVESDFMKSELYWRLGLAVFMEGKEQYYNGIIEKKTMIAHCQTCREYAEMAIRFHEDSDNGYLMKAQCIAERIALKGVFSRLTNDDNVVEMLKTAVSLNPNNYQALAWLGEIYMGLASMPLSSRKNIEYAVSFSRAAVHIHDALYEKGEIAKKDYHTYSTLARSLKTRNWSIKKRQGSLERMRTAHDGVRCDSIT
jgi:hypothetical protein